MAATAELEVLGVGLTEPATTSISLEPSTGTLAEAFALLRLAGRRLDRMSEPPTSMNSESSGRESRGRGKRTSRAR